MKRTLTLLKQDFESSSGTTPEFKAFCKVFKTEFTEELEKVNAHTIIFHNGHFDITGFFTVGDKIYYFSLSDVRGMFHYNIMYRTAKHYKDWTGGSNQYIDIAPGMAERMRL